MHESSKHPSQLEFRSALRGANLHYLANVFEFRRDQAHRCDSRATHYVDGPGNHAELESTVPTNKSNATGPHPENLREPVLQSLPWHRILVNAQRAIRKNLHDYHTRPWCCGPSFRLLR